MQKIKELSVTESMVELRKLQRLHPSKFKSLQMLVLIKQQGNMSKYGLAELLSSSHSSVAVWRNNYLRDGISGLLTETRGGRKPASIQGKVYEQLHARLHDPKGGFRSYTEMQQWLEATFGIVIGYHALNKFVKRKFGARPKVSRKSHVLKDAAAEAVFKKTV